MTRLAWGDVGERLYEVGVDRGVLYIDGGVGVPWNGLISVSEEPTGGEAKPYYIDGVKYLNRALAEEFEATVEAYTYPSEFSKCDGTVAFGNGLFATQQKRRPFGLAYRSRVGNDLLGSDFGYKIHLIYNALAAPSQQVHSTISDTVDPFNFSWKVTALPPRLAGHKPTAHFTIDSRETPRPLLTQIEDILYGSSAAEPRLPSLPELMYIFTSYNASTFDAGDVNDPSFRTFDGGVVPAAQTSTIDGGMA